MPPLPALHIKALDDLDRQLRFAPPGAARRQLERAEELFASLDPDQTYPEEWVVFAITGYRPDIASPSLLIGAALRAELGILAERLSAAAELGPEDLPGLDDPTPGWLDAEALCMRWKISRKTLDRYRRRAGCGLPARRVRDASGRDRLYFSLRFVGEFESRHADLLRGAAGFSRMDPALEAKLLRLAAKYRGRLGWSLNKTALRLAERFGRGHETIRQLLRRHNAAPGADAPGGDGPAVFTERGPLEPRERAVIRRAYTRGVRIEAMAERFGRTRPSIYRVLARERADFLRSLALVEDASTERLAAVLESPSSLTGLGRVVPATLEEMRLEAEAEPLPDPRAERERATACLVLRSQAAALIAALPRHNPAAGACDEIETRLRWASRLRVELVRSQQGLVFRSIRAALGRDLTTLGRAGACSLLEACMGAVIEAADRFDPLKGGRLAAPVGLALNRVVSRWAKASGLVGPDVPASRASPHVDAAEVIIGDWSRLVDPWQPRLEPDARVRAVLHRIDPAHAELLAARLGWSDDAAGGGPPLTIAAVAAARSITAHHASAFEHEAIGAALRAARSETPRG